MARQLPKTTTYWPDAAVEGVVVLVHGLTRSSRSLSKLRQALVKQNFAVVGLDYPSRSVAISQLAEAGISTALAAARDVRPHQPIHFVTHSLGGILLRVYLDRHRDTKIGRTVMIAPPNQGSEVVDALKQVPGFGWINGPAGFELGTRHGSIPRSLGPVTFKVGVIAGVKTVNPFLSLLLPKPNDGKVSLVSTQVEGMADFLSIDASHTFIVDKKEVIEQAISFLKNGQFNRDVSTGREFEVRPSTHRE